MRDDERYRLLFGPYAAPPARRGDTLECEYRGEEIRVGGLTDAPIPWPRALKTGRPSLIVCGDLARAVRCESEIAVAHHWGISIVTVWKWRKALGVVWTEGTTRLYRDYIPEKIDADAVARMTATARTPEARRRQADLKRGRKAHPKTAAALRKAAKRKKSKSHRRAMSVAHRKRLWGQSRKPVVPGQRLWTPAEERLLGRAVDRVVAIQTGRTVAAVRSRRYHLGIAASRHSVLARTKKPRPGDFV